MAFLKGASVSCPALTLRVISVMIATTTILSVTANPVRGQLTLEDVIENVRQNEQLYKDVEVVMDTTYDIGDRPVTEEREVIRLEVRTRFVSQGDWFRLEMDGESHDSENTVSKDRIRAFDGETTRVLEQNAVGNIAAERIEDENFIRPHLLPIRYTHLAVPLSVYLSGHEAIQSHRNGRWNQDLTMEVSYLGEEEFDGLRCHKVLVDVLLKSGDRHDGREFWLAEDRNYLPVRQLAYTYRFSNSIPVGQSVVHDLREIRPGVWFPFDVEITSYNKIRIQQQGRQELQWTERYVVEQAELDPQYDREFFANVEFPDGTAVYEVQNGEILRSWRVGAPEAPGGPTAQGSFSRWWLLWVNLGVLSVLGLLVGLRVRRKAGRKAAASVRSHG